MTQPSTRLYSFLPTLWASHISPLRNRIYYLDKHLGCKDQRLSQAIFRFLLWGCGGGSEGRGTAWNWEGLRHQGSSTRPPPLPSAHCHDRSQARPLEGAFRQTELVTTGELITSLDRLFPEATLGLQRSYELVLCLPLFSSVASPMQTLAQHCFFERGWGSTVVSPEENVGQGGQGYEYP